MQTVQYCDPCKKVATTPKGDTPTPCPDCLGEMAQIGWQEVAEQSLTLG